ncbi:MAG: hypothetical protein GY835_27890 [bacterium]|nr:hypothetical protein [bacterium]
MMMRISPMFLLIMILATGATAGAPSVSQSVVSPTDQMTDPCLYGVPTCGSALSWLTVQVNDDNGDGVPNVLVELEFDPASNVVVCNENDLSRTTGLTGSVSIPLRFGGTCRATEVKGDPDEPLCSIFISLGGGDRIYLRGFPRIVSADHRGSKGDPDEPDRSVDSSDLAYFGSIYGDPGNDGWRIDYNGDGQVTLADNIMFGQAYNLDCE